MERLLTSADFAYGSRLSPHPSPLPWERESTFPAFMLARYFFGLRIERITTCLWRGYRLNIRADLWSYSRQA